MDIFSRKALALILLAGLIAVLFGIAMSPPSSAQMCKWTDENGTVHYAERCPDEVEGDSVEIQEGPSDAAVEAAHARSRDYEESRRAREADETLAVDESRYLDDSVDMDRAIQCVTAIREMRILRLQLAVFYDENGRLHHNRSQFDYNYEGPRSYISDADRPAVMRETQRVMDQYCGDSEEDKALQRVAAAAMLDAELCRNWEIRVKKLLRSRESGAREMAEWLEERCQ